MNGQTISRAENRVGRVRKFLKKPWDEKAASFFFRWSRAFPGIPVPVRLPFGSWWLAKNDFVGSALFYGGFENTERSFVENYLRPGMVVVDIGAHHGFYTLLASRKVGSDGRVLAIEASPRERKKLRLHLRINSCRNVEIENSAVGEREADSELYLVFGRETGCNSLRRPAVSEPNSAVSIHIERLDDMLHRRKIAAVDLVKIDVEGAELSALKGAPHLLTNRPRPVVLAEVQDIRTKPWGYPARDIIRFLLRANYQWFRPLPAGKLQAIDTEQEDYDGNFVAVPDESIEALRGMIAPVESRKLGGGKIPRQQKSGFDDSIAPKMGT